jgi:tRNA-Thr(GGU) m(6)t(6)A37 methyltransferase TsaA
MGDFFRIYPIGRVNKSDSDVRIEIFDDFTDGLFGLDGFSHIYVFYWFHENDTPEKRQTLQVHPRGDSQNPLTGVFGTHSPVRPNLIALTLCKVLAIAGNCIQIEDIDALDRSPVIDIKCYIPDDAQDATAYRVPKWV